MKYLLHCIINQRKVVIRQISNIIGNQDLLVQSININCFVVSNVTFQDQSRNLEFILSPRALGKDIVRSKFKAQVLIFLYVTDVLS